MSPSWGRCLSAIRTAIEAGNLPPNLVGPAKRTEIRKCANPLGGVPTHKVSAAASRLERCVKRFRWRDSVAERGG
jgi:hypothetical protein